MLVVEDEAVVAMELTRVLTAAGAKVIGPAGTIEEAMQLLDAHPVDRALLDDENSSSESVVMRMHRPQKTGPLIVTADRPWEGAICYYNSIVQVSDSDFRIYCKIVILSPICLLSVSLIQEVSPFQTTSRLDSTVWTRWLCRPTLGWTCRR